MLSDIDIGAFHPVFIHFPIALIFIAFICDFISLIGRRGAGIVAAWMIIGAAVMVIPTAFTGLEASERFPPNDPNVYRHWLLAIITATFVIAYASLRGYALFRDSFLPNTVYLIISLLLVLSVSLTADAGGVVTRGSSIIFGPLSNPPAPTTAASAQAEKISVAQAQKVFADNHCAQCHAHEFDADGYPANLSKNENIIDNQTGVLLPRHGDGTLDHPENSPFYDVVIRKNQMPIRQHAAPGLTDQERLVLLEWLIQNAPTNRTL